MGSVLLEHATKMGFVEHDEVVEGFVSNHRRPVRGAAGLMVSDRPGRSPEAGKQAFESITPTPGGARDRSRRAAFIGAL